MSDFDLKQLIETADKILIGMGEDFDSLGEANEQELNEALMKISEMHDESMVPYVYDAYRQRAGVVTAESLNNLIELIKDKDYYVLTTSTNLSLCELPWKKGRFISPCISSKLLQCMNKCGDGPIAMGDEIRQRLLEFGNRCMSNSGNYEKPDLGVCPVCGNPLYPNNIFAPNYDERGYLEGWGRYTSWLPFTLRNKILIIELGVGMNFPGMIRMPFEKTATLNQKAVFVRVNNTLPFLPAGLEGRSYLINKNAIEWLNGLC